MERAQSAPAGPVLSDEDYRMPRHGIGDTGHPNRITHGPLAKDTGTYSSRINQIIRQAQKYPGPGKYVGHQEWQGNFGTHCGNKFAGGSREWRSLAKGPDPRHYERKDLMGGAGHDPAKEPIIYSNAAKESLSKNRRIIHGKIPKGKKRSFMDQAIRHGAGSPAPGHYHAKDIFKAQVVANKLTDKPLKMTDWSKEVSKSVSRAPPKPEEVGPGHYKISYDSQFERQALYSVPKELASNFLDKAVKERMISVRPNRVPYPGPGQYDMQNFPLHKTSRGTFHAQLRGISRAPVSGYL